MRLIPAIIDDQGLIRTGRIHADIIDCNPGFQGQEGFITDEQPTQFLDRHQAMAVAMHHGLVTTAFQDQHALKSYMLNPQRNK